MNKTKKNYAGRIKQSEHIFTLKIKTEGNGLGVLKTIIVVATIAVQAIILILSYLYFANLFRGYLTFSLVMTLISCIFVLSSDFHGQAKATWIFFLFISLGFGYVIYFMSEKHILFAKSRKKFAKINKQNANLQIQEDLSDINVREVKTNCDYLYNAGKFVSYTNSKATYFPSGARFFDAVLEDMEKAKDFIFWSFL